VSDHKKHRFEEQMERLQLVVETLEKGDLPLEKSVALYKEGQILAASCREQLENARHAVKMQTESGLADFASSGPDAGEDA
jgi:exodeoxyribonuclease VII small subunit